MPLAALALGIATFVAVFFGLPSPAAGRGAPSGPPLAPRPSSSPMYVRAAVVAERLKRLWTEATGDPGPPSPAALEILLSQAALESGIAEPGVNGWESEEIAHLVTQGIEDPAAWGLLSSPGPEPIDDDTAWGRRDEGQRQPRCPPVRPERAEGGRSARALLHLRNGGGLEAEL